MAYKGGGVVQVKEKGEVDDISGQEQS